MTYYDDMRSVGASPALVAGFDLLTDDGMPLETAASMLVAVERKGDDPEAYARHILKLRRALRGIDAEKVAPPPWLGDGAT